MRRKPKIEIVPKQFKRCAESKMTIAVQPTMLYKRHVLDIVLLPLNDIILEDS